MNAPCYESSGNRHFILEPEQVQQGYFLASLDGYLSDLVHHYLKDHPSPEVFGPKSSLEHCICQHVDKNNPVYTRRRELFSTRQTLGQDVQLHINNFQRLADEADTITMTNDDWMTHLLVQSFVGMDELRSDIFKEKNLTFTRVLELAFTIQ